ncbi:MAG: patatin-like phospholipase family protein [Pirellulales bacterium]
MSLYTEQELALARQVLWRSPLCRGLSPEDIETVAHAVKPLHFSSGQTIFNQNDIGDWMCVVARGRVKITFDVGRGPPRLLEYLGKGDHFGELAILTDFCRTAGAVAIMDTDLLRIDRAGFERLMHCLPGFAANISKGLGQRLRRQTRGHVRRRTPKVVGMVNSTLRTQGLIGPLAHALVERRNALVVLTERSEKWPTDGEYLLERIPESQEGRNKATVVHNRLAQLIENHDRILLDLTMKGLENELPAVLSQCEEIWWLIDPAYVDASRRNLQRLLEAEPKLASRIHAIWILSDERDVAPASFRDLGIDPLDFKIVTREKTGQSFRGQQQGIGRLVRHLQGTRIGLALGGGGARGLAHLGVLKGLEQAGIGFDLLAGTSSGALMGLSYVAGWRPDEATADFAKQLTPPRWLRAMPGGLHWYLWWMFRTGGWDRKLRPYLGDTTLEQLQLPLSTVAVDLVSGRLVVRDTGDAINCVLESINLPPISRPIMRDGMALIDGGLLNNLPADVLIERGADLVIGIDVVAKLKHQFAGSTSRSGTKQMRKARTVETLMRLNEVQDHGVAAMRRSVADVVIAPETAQYEFADFSQSRPLAEAGEAAAAEMIPLIQQKIADLERA